MKYFLTGLLFAAILTGCGGGVGSPEQINGTITSRDGMSIPPNASVHVELVQSTNGNETVVADTTFQLTSQQAPIQFSLNLGNHKMVKNDRYLVRAHVMGDAGQPMYSTVDGIPITAATAANVEVLVQSSGMPSGSVDTGTSATDTTGRMRDTGATDTPGGSSSTSGNR